MIDVDCLLPGCFLFDFGERRIRDLFHANGQLFVLWSGTVAKEVGITRISRSDDGCVKKDADFLLPVKFPESSEVSLSTSLLYDKRIIFVIEAPFSRPDGWGSHRYVITFDPETNLWEEAVGRRGNGTLNFRSVVSSSAPTGKPLTGAEVILFVDEGLLKCGFDYTPYHLDDWERNDDVHEFATNAEVVGVRLARESRIFFQTERNRRPSFTESFYIPIDKAATKLVSYFNQIDQTFCISNLLEKLFQEFPRTSSPQHALHLRQMRMPKPETTAWDKKEGVLLEGKLSDLLQPTASENDEVATVPDVAKEGVVCAPSGGPAFCAIRIHVTKNTSCVATVDLPRA